MPEAPVISIRRLVDLRMVPSPRLPGSRRNTCRRARGRLGGSYIHGLVKVFHRLSGSAQIGQSNPAIVIGSGVIRFELNGRVIVSYRVLIVSGSGIDVAPKSVKPCIVRIKADGLKQIVDSVLRLAQIE